MVKALTSALAITIFISSAAAEPIQMTDEKLDLIHGGDGSSLQLTLINKPDGSAVLIQNGVEYRITGPTLVLPDGTQVQITRNSNGSTILVTKGGSNISESLAVSGTSANVTSSFIGTFSCNGCN